jgi:nitrite reductase/ring-hydroxylating ferredoxin subunit
MAIKQLLLKFLVKIVKMRQVVLKRGKYFISFIFLFLFSLSCDKINDYPIPDVPVSYIINLNIANELTVPGNSLYFSNAGFGGLIVYCEMPGSWYAFDAACTYEASATCIVKNEGVLADCPCCKSQFVLISGAYPTQSPASLPLKQYNVSMVNNFTLRIYN